LLKKRLSIEKEKKKMLQQY